MTITIYRSDDSSAPVLSGQAGALVGVLDACLVNGYGAKTAAGFAIAFTGTNKRAYRAAAGNRLYLRVDDTGTTEGRVVGYESMSDVDTGTSPFPTAAQVSGGLFIGKSTTANSTARPWILIADDKAFVLVTECSQTTLGSSSSTDSCMQFGDGKSYKTSDAYFTTIMAQGVTGSNASQMCTIAAATSFAVTVGHYVARAYTQIGGSVNFMKAEACTLRSGTTIGGTDGTKPAYPDPVTGGLLLSPMLVLEQASSAGLSRGQMAGLWIPQHDISLTSNFDTFDGTGDLAGISFMILRGYNSSTAGRFVVQTSGSWR